MSDSSPQVQVRGIGRQGGGPGRFMAERVRPKDARHTLGRLARLFRPRLLPFLAAFAFVSADAACGLAAPWLTGRAIDGAAGRLPVSPALLAGVLAAVYLADALVSWLQGLIMAGLSQRLGNDLRRSLFSALTRLPIPCFDRRDRGDLMSRMSNDVDNLATGISQAGSQLMGALIGVGGSLLLMLLLSPLLTLAALATVPLVLLLTRWVGKGTRDRFRAQQNDLGSLNACIEESVNGFLEVKAFGREDDVAARFEALNASLKKSGTTAQIWAGMVMPLMNVINNLGFALLALVGGWLCIRGAVTVGVIASFVGYSRQFGRPLNDIANSWNTLQSAIAGAERVFEVLDEEAEEPDGSESLPLTAPRGEISFRNVNFSYRPGIPVLKELDLEVPPGATIALVGPTGSGKTTVVSLLLRFYEPDSGSILLDGRPLRAWKRADLRHSFGVVLQDAWLFEGSVADNIRYGKPEASDAEVEAAARAANAEAFISRLPGGYAAPVGPGGSLLSQGQRQLLSIARAVLADAPFLILDEATSNVDTRTEFRLQEALMRLMRGRTCFVIAHRLSTIREADRIVLIEAGRIVEAGTHEELLARGGAYAALHAASAAPAGPPGDSFDRSLPSR